MIALVPKPTWADLAAVIRPLRRVSIPSDAFGMRTCESFVLSRSAWALAAIVKWWETAQKDARPSLWIPAYFCNQSLAPVRTTGAQLVFYPVDANAQPDWVACRDLLNREPCNLFVLVHTFGNVGDLGGAQDFCRTADATLIEDAAHCLRAEDGIGSVGTFTFFSPYKTLPVPDGGLLFARQGDVSAALAPIIVALGDGVPSTTSWAIKRAIQKTLPECLLDRITGNRGQTDFDADPMEESLAVTPQASSAARCLLARQAGRLDAIAARRRENWAVLAAHPWPSGCRPLPCSSTPYRFVLQCADHATAVKLFEQCRDAGIPAESWPDLPLEVIATENTFETALHLRRTLVLLPIHQDMDANRLRQRLG